MYNHLCNQVSREVPVAPTRNRRRRTPARPLLVLSILLGWATAAGAQCPDDLWPECEWCGRDCFISTGGGTSGHTDMTHNMVVDLVDWGLFSYEFRIGSGSHSADLDRNGIVALADLAIFGNCYRNHPDFSGRACPQPTGVGGSIRLNFSGDPNDDVDRLDLAAEEYGLVHIVAQGCPELGGVEACLETTPNVQIDGVYASGTGMALDPGIVAFYPLLDGGAHTVMEVEFHVTDTVPAEIRLADCGSTPQGGLSWADLIANQMNGFAAVSHAGVNGDAPPDSLAGSEGVAPIGEGARVALLARPNPSRADVDLALVAPPDGPARLTIHDAAGRLIRTLVSGETLSEKGVQWDRRSDGGSIAPSGVYFARLTGGVTTATRLIVLLPR